MSVERPAEPCFDNDDTRPAVDTKVLEELGFNLLNEYDWSDK